MSDTRPAASTADAQIRLIFEPDEVREMRPLTTWAIALKDYRLPRRDITRRRLL